MTDRVLDADVAEKVMGWTVELIVSGRDAFEEWRDPQGWRYGATPPSYSSDIAAAWQVVEHMRTRGWRFEIHELWEGWRAIFVLRATYAEYQERAESAPLAICRAALAAIGSVAESDAPSTAVQD
jgi:hypothetical protein